MIRTFLNTAPGEVISITADSGSTPRFCLKSMKPFPPNEVMSAPGFRVHRVDAIAHEVEDPLTFRPLPVHDAAVPAAGPRCRCCICAGSNDQISLPVAAFSATAFRLGVVTYITPFTTTGFACIVDRWFASPVLYSQARSSRCTLAAWICASAEY